MHSNFALTVALSAASVALQAVHANRFVRSVGSNQAVSSLSSSALPLRIHAATFNAGNKVFTKGKAGAEADELLQELVKGHEVPGQEADIVLLGLQEVCDPDFELREHVRNNILWANQTTHAARDLRREMTRLAEAPEDVQNAKSLLSQKINQFLQELEAQTEAFRDRFSAKAGDFRNRAAAASPPRAILDSAKELASDVVDKVRILQRTHDTAVFDAPADEFEDLRADTVRLKKSVDEYPSKDVQDGLAPIKEWTSKVLRELEEARAKFPNLALEPQGQDAIDKFKDSIDNIKMIESVLLDVGADGRSRRKAFMDDVHVYGDGIEESVIGVQKKISNTLLKDLLQIDQATDRFRNDLQKAETPHIVNSMITDYTNREQDEMQKGKQPAGQRMQEALQTWRGRMEDQLKELLSPRVLGISNDEADVKSYSERFRATYWCKGHYDTVLYVYANPWSSWKIEPVAYSSDRCTIDKDSKRSEDLPYGCSINNVVGWECGKAVNLLVFDAEKDGKRFRLCAMNTHMSFSSMAQRRVKMITDAAEEAKAAGCESMVFVGDFNSRLHCDDIDNYSRGVPPFDQNTASESSFQFLEREICVGSDGSEKGWGKCSLAGSPGRMYDEMTQIMEQDVVTCWEKNEKTDKAKWDLQPTTNTVKDTGLREAASPEFAPTYKYSDMQSAKKGAQPNFRKCIGDEVSCLANKDKRPSHNPGWTDRILVSAGDSSADVESTVVLSTTTYERRPIGSQFGSDHYPVVAQLTADVLKK